MTKFDWPALAAAITGPERRRKTLARVRAEEVLSRHFGDLDGADWLRQVGDDIEAQARGSGALLPAGHRTEESAARLRVVVFYDAAEIGAKVMTTVLTPFLFPDVKAKPVDPADLVDPKEKLERLRKGRP